MAPGIAIYQRTDRAEGQRPGLKGLLDMTTGQHIIAPTYDRIDPTGRVTLTDNCRTMAFYIDPATGRAFRFGQ